MRHAPRRGHARYTYARGDATKAYNNPTYNQAMDGQLAGNKAKVSRFQREFVYLGRRRGRRGSTWSSSTGWA